MGNILKLIISILIPVATGAMSGFFTTTGVDSWYQAIQKPSWNPPSWVFAPVWTSLYVMMGVSLYLVWKSDVELKRKRIAITLFAAQLVLNFFWSLIFFTLQSPGWALVEIIVMWLFILLTIFSFAKIRKVAAWLLVPYISWVSFATILTYTIWRLNS